MTAARLLDGALHQVKNWNGRGLAETQDLLKAELERIDKNLVLSDMLLIFQAFEEDLNSVGVQPPAAKRHMVIRTFLEALNEDTIINENEFRTLHDQIKGMYRLIALEIEKWGDPNRNMRGCHKVFALLAEMKPGQKPNLVNDSQSTDMFILVSGPIVLRRCLAKVLAVILSRQIIDMEERSFYEKLRSSSTCFGIFISSGDRTIVSKSAFAGKLAIIDAISRSATLLQDVLQSLPHAWRDSEITSQYRFPNGAIPPI